MCEQAVAEGSRLAGHTPHIGGKLLAGRSHCVASASVGLEAGTICQPRSVQDIVDALTRGRDSHAKKYLFCANSLVLSQLKGKISWCKVRQNLRLSSIDCEPVFQRGCGSGERSQAGVGSVLGSTSTSCKCELCLPVCVVACSASRGLELSFASSTVWCACSVAWSLF